MEKAAAISSEREVPRDGICFSPTLPVSHSVSSAPGRCQAYSYLPSFSLCLTVLCLQTVLPSLFPNLPPPLSGCVCRSELGFRCPLLNADVFDPTEKSTLPLLFCGQFCVVLIMTCFFIVFVVYLSTLRVGCLSDSLLCSRQNMK